MGIRDWTFQKVFGELLVYTILFEDAEVDERFLGIDEGSTVLGISGAGCRIAGHVSQRPRRVDAVDINPHHLALTALKVAAAQRLPSYETFYALFGRGWLPKAEATIRTLVEPLPRWIQDHWKREASLFSQPIFSRGLAARSFRVMRELTGVNESWLRWLCGESIAARHRAIDEWVAPVLRRPWVRAALNSPMNLLAMGVNYAQVDRLKETEGEDMANFIISLLKRVAATDLSRNWFAWHVIAGKYNHEVHDAVPPFVRKDRHERSFQSPTQTNFHRRNIFDVLAQAERDTWSHYTLCDAPDWMPEQTQRKLFNEILRTSRDGAVVQYRTVEKESIIERLGFDKRIQPMVDISVAATQLDRSRLFNRVGFYRVAH
jgi:S-adenosylmethionine-diacylglycerol 3-amino-3-carboxypropyl transferase